MESVRAELTTATSQLTSQKELTESQANKMAALQEELKKCRAEISDATHTLQQVTLASRVTVTET